MALSAKDSCRIQQAELDPLSRHWQEVGGDQWTKNLFEKQTWAMVENSLWKTEGHTSLQQNLCVFSHAPEFGEEGSMGSGESFQMV